MKQSQIEKVVAELQAEKAIVDACIERLMVAGTDKTVLDDHAATLAACITRLSGNGTVAPKVARTRKGRKAAPAGE